MTPAEFWVRAAQWGSYMHSGDRGAGMYGFDERGAVQSEEHRAACIEWLNVDCRRGVDEISRSQDVLTIEDVASANVKDIDELIEYLKTAPTLDTRSRIRTIQASPNRK